MRHMTASQDSTLRVVSYAANGGCLPEVRIARRLHSETMWTGSSSTQDSRCGNGHTWLQYPPKKAGKPVPSASCSIGRARSTPSIWANAAGSCEPAGSPKCLERCTVLDGTPPPTSTKSTNTQSTTRSLLTKRWDTPWQSGCFTVRTFHIICAIGWQSKSVRYSVPPCPVYERLKLDEPVSKHIGTAETTLRAEKPASAALTSLRKRRFDRDVFYFYVLDQDDFISSQPHKMRLPFSPEAEEAASTYLRHVWQRKGVAQMQRFELLQR